MAFTTLILFQLFDTVDARSDERSAFITLVINRWLWGAIALSVLFQLLVLYVPTMQRAFGTVGLSPGDWLRCVDRQLGALAYRSKEGGAGCSEEIAHYVEQCSWY